MNDPETQQQVAENEKMASLVKTQYWAEAKRKLFDKIASQLSVENIDLKEDPQRIAVGLEAAQIAVRMVKEWIQEVEGVAKTHEDKPQEEKEPELVKQFE